jgi:imidazolonepropionase-like amidohydrolase
MTVRPSHRAFHVGVLVDGTGAPPIEDAVLVLEGGRITAVGRHGEVEIPPHAELVVDPGATLLPGLVDVHVHLAYSGIPDTRAFRAEAVDHSYGLLALRAAAHAQATLAAGFTTVRDLHAPGGVVIDLRRAIEAGYVAGPRVRACGLGLSATGGHMDQPGFGDHASFADMTSPRDGPDAFRRGVREQVKRGADLVKINVCVSSRRDPRQPWRQEMTDDEIRAAVAEAHMLERHVAAHTSGGPAIATAVEAGLDSVEHGHWIDERTADLMAERGTTYVPTLLVNERNFDFTPAELGTTAAGWRWLELAREAKWESLDRVRRAGAPIALGSDAGFMLPHGTMNAKELELLVHGGLSVVEALRASTSAGADLLGLDDVGRLTPGAVADLLLVKGDVRVDIRVLQRRDALRIYQAGHPYEVRELPAPGEEHRA